MAGDARTAGSTTRGQGARGHGRQGARGGAWERPGVGAALSASGALRAGAAAGLRAAGLAGGSGTAGPAATAGPASTAARVSTAGAAAGARAAGRVFTLALPRGRPWVALRPLLLQAGVPGLAEADPEVRLCTVHGSTRLIFSRPADVVTYVREGVADAGVTGKDVLLEDGEGVCELLELPAGEWRMSVAAPPEPPWPQLLAARGDALRVATSYPLTASRHFASRGVLAHVVRLRGAVELAPLVGLADCVVDMVETGRTLAAHGLAEVERVARITLRLVANPVSHRWRRHELDDLCARLAAGPGRTAPPGG